MRALLVANRADDDPGFVGERLRDVGYSFTGCPREEPSGWPALDGADLVLSLGSDWSVYWDHVALSVAAEADLLREAHRRGVPALGICYGGQMLSSALGGSVERAPSAEIGWYEVTSSLAALAGDGPWFEWHVDRFTPPPGVEPLASTTAAVQAYRIGRSVALQFHPEVDSAIVARWASGGADELARHGIDADVLLDRTRAETARSRVAAHALVDWFVSVSAG